MDKIFDFMHSLCAGVTFMVTLVLIDIPLKVVSLLFFLVIVSLMCIIYPLVKHIEFPNWWCDWYDYSKSTKNTLAKKVWKAWQR